MQTGTFDSHGQMPFENMRTDITVTNKDAVPRVILRRPAPTSDAERCTGASR
jgi:hypothetical protein